mmetsp:Transcript_2768/g.5079  ORF Transcript_2768/g.5079 Transcript_2768/m.5079 type:complete len:215 (+) Transcript_2768:257-901(+)
MLGPEREGLFLAKVKFFGIVMNNLDGFRVFAHCDSARAGETIECDGFAVLDVVDGALGRVVSDHGAHGRRQVLDVPQAGEMHAVARNRNGAPRIDSLKEPFLQRVVVERPVDVGWADRSVWDSFRLQILLRLELPLVSGLGVQSVTLAVRHDVGLEINPCRTHIHVLLYSSLEQVDKRLGICELATRIIIHNIEMLPFELRNHILDVLTVTFDG